MPPPSSRTGKRGRARGEHLNPQLPPITVSAAPHTGKSAGDHTVHAREDDDKSTRVAKAVEAACRSPISKDPRAAVSAKQQEMAEAEALSEALKEEFRRQPRRDLLQGIRTPVGMGRTHELSKLWKLPYTLSEDQVSQIIDLVLSEKAQGALDAQQGSSSDDEDGVGASSGDDSSYSGDEGRASRRRASGSSRRRRRRSSAASQEEQGQYRHRGTVELRRTSQLLDGGTNRKAPMLGDASAGMGGSGSLWLRRRSSGGLTTGRQGVGEGEEAAGLLPALDVTLPTAMDLEQHRLFTEGNNLKPVSTRGGDFPSFYGKDGLAALLASPSHKQQQPHEDDHPQRLHSSSNRQQHEQQQQQQQQHHNNNHPHPPQQQQQPPSDHAVHEEGHLTQPIRSKRDLIEALVREQHLQQVHQDDEDEDDEQDDDEQDENNSREGSEAEEGEEEGAGQDEQGGEEGAGGGGEGSTTWKEQMKQDYLQWLSQTKRGSGQSLTGGGSRTGSFSSSSAMSSARSSGSSGGRASARGGSSKDKTRWLVLYEDSKVRADKHNKLRQQEIADRRSRRLSNFQKLAPLPAATKSGGGGGVEGGHGEAAEKGAA